MMDMTPWVWVCKNDSELVYEVLTLGVPKRRRTLIKQALKGGVVVANIVLYLKNWGIL